MEFDFGCLGPMHKSYQNKFTQDENQIMNPPHLDLREGESTKKGAKHEIISGFTPKPTPITKISGKSFSFLGSLFLSPVFQLFC